MVETDIHYPTDSTLLGDGVRVLTRIMKRVTAVAGKAGTQMRDRSRSAKLKVLAIARASRNSKTEQGRQEDEERVRQIVGNRQPGYGASLEVLARDRRRGVKRGNPSNSAQSRQATGRNDSPGPAGAAPDTRERVLRGNTKAEGKLLSIFETHTEGIRKWCGA